MQRRATYRLQLRPEFNFRDAIQVLPYLRDLGVTHVYCSPYFQAARGSSHGYDVTDPARISDQLGGPGAQREFSEQLRGNGLAQVLDIVPNHMCVTDSGNWRWWDVLKQGRRSVWAETFDIDWEASERVLVPILGDTLERVLEREELRLEGDGADLVVRYFDHVLPVENPEATTDGIRALLDRQHYRLACWREAPDQINYRRFFDVNSLAGVRVEDPHVFGDTQQLAIELVEAGAVDGLRIDHVDGLREPREFLSRLREHIGAQPWLLVEKILDQGERLPPGWPVEGTTGYEFAAVAGGLFVDPSGRAPLAALAAEMTGDQRGVREVIDECKQLVCDRSFGADIARLARLLGAACAERGEHRDRTLDECTDAITAVLVGLPVYRTYAAGDDRPLSEQDRGALTAALRHAGASHPRVAPGLLDLIGRLAGGGERSDAEVDFVLRLQQTGAAVIAKGVEDTAFYRCLSLVSICEVGDSPLHWGTSIAECHRHNALAAEQNPSGLLATSTHDTKRSEDVRMRLHVLSEFAGLWASRAHEWSARNARHKTAGDPDAADELLLYQTLIGAHPLEADRAAAYMEKATREAKRRMSWTDPDPAYERAVRSFTRAVVADGAFAEELAEFAAPLVTLGRVNSLSLTLLKLTAPGVPDVYQGCELWDLSLVDPDNRRRVDYDLRRAALSRADDARTLVSWNDECGGAKLALIRRSLALRDRRDASFAPGGAYVPLRAHGGREDHVFAFQRGDDVISMVPRLVGGVSGFSADYQPVWADTRVRLPAGRWRDVLSGLEHSGDALVSSLLGAVPVALLERTAT